MTFAVGSTITVREVWWDQVWLHFPELVVHDGEVLATLRIWKDVEALQTRLAERWFTSRDLHRVLAAAPEVVDRLDRDDRWWASCDEWLPTDLPVES